MRDWSFLTVHDLELTPDEFDLWGGLPRRPEDYPRLDGMSAQDSALTHMVLVCMDRRNYEAARRYAEMLSDPRMREMRIGLIPSKAFG